MELFVALRRLEVDWEAGSMGLDGGSLAPSAIWGAVSRPAGGESRLPALEAVFREHHQAVFEFAYWLTDSYHEAADLTQEVFLRLLQRGGPSDPEAVRAWLLRVTANLAKDRWRRRRREDSANHRAVDEVAPPVSVNEQMLRNELQDRVHQAIRALPPDLRQLVALRDLQGLSYSEIAAILGRPLGTVRSGLHRARQRLEESLRPYLEGEE